MKRLKASRRDPVSRHGVVMPRLRLPLPVQHALGTVNGHIRLLLQHDV